MVRSSRTKIVTVNATTISKVGSEAAAGSGAGVGGRFLPKEMKSPNRLGVL